MSSEKERGLKIHANVIMSPSSYYVECKELSAEVGISSTVLSGLDNLDTYMDSLYKTLKLTRCCSLRLSTTWTFIKIACNTGLALPSLFY